MAWIVIIVVLVVAILGILFIIGVLATIGSFDEAYREIDDREQEEYIRRWMSEKRHKQETKSTMRNRR